MIWYLNNKQMYEYPSNEPVDNPIVSCCTNTLYEFEGENKITDLVKGIISFKAQNFYDLNIILPIEYQSVNCGSQDDIDINFCEQNNIPYKIAPREGGAMLLYPGDICTISAYYSNTFLRQHHLLNDFTIYLQEKGYETVTSNNDVLLEGKKVASAATQNLPFPLNKIKIMQTHFSIAPLSIDMINKICKKPMLKQPGSLSEYDISYEEIRQWLFQWFSNNTK